MARKRKARKSAKPRRRMNGVARRSPRRRRMNAAAMNIGTEVSTVGQLAVGALAGGFLISMTEKIAPNYYVRAGGAIGVGLLLGRFMPQAKTIGYGIATAGAVGIGGQLMAKVGVAPGAVNRARRLSDPQLKALHAKLIEAEKRGAPMNLAQMLNAVPQTLNAARVPIAGSDDMGTFA